MKTDGVGHSTVDHVYKLLRAILNVGITEDMIVRNPALGVKTPAISRREPFFLTEEQVAALVSAAPEANRPLLLFLPFTGARIGEATALRVRNLNLLGRTVRFTENASEVRGKRVIGETKSKRVRSVPLLPFLAERLVSYLGHRPDSGDLDALVFRSPDGRPVRQANFRKRVLYPSARKAGITRNGGELPTAHDLRHTFASLMAAAGYSLHEVKEMLGHRSIQTTSDLYVHLFPHREDDRARALDARARTALSADGELPDVVAAI